MLMNGVAYSARAISNPLKMLIKLTTGANVIKLFVAAMNQIREHYLKGKAQYH
jgi:hypothetical protein